MKGTRLERIAHLAQGELVQGDAQALVQGISTDSRSVGQGQLFFALSGERFDGHDYVVAAAAAGAVGVVCAESQLHRIRRELTQVGHDGTAIIVVRDTLVGLQLLASGYRDQFSPAVVGVTGSVGKTTTKDLTAGVLSARYKTLKTQGNFNNEIGLPLTLLRLSDEHEAAVMEMGMRGSGQIAALARLAKPSVGIVTNVHPVHVELLGSLEAIARAKSELITALPSSGCAVLNGDDPLVRKMGELAQCRVLTFGAAADNDLQIRDNSSMGSHGINAVFAYGGKEYQAHIPIPGKHNAHNAAAAVLAGVACGLSLPEAIGGLSSYVPSGMRMEVAQSESGTVVINDAYNANPAAMRAAIDTAAQMAQGRPLWLILGDMLELGEMSEAAHEELGRYVVQYHPACLLAVGQHAGEVMQGATEAGMPSEQVLTAASAAKAKELCLGLPRQGAVILVKGSRGVGLEIVAQSLQD